MKTARILKIKKTPDTPIVALDALMREFCASRRYAFNRLLEGFTPNELNKAIPAMFKLNKRYAEDATMLAKAIISSQKELLPYQLEGVQGKISKTEQKLSDYESGRKTPQKVDLETCLKGLGRRLEKLRAREAYLTDCMEKGTIPKVIFGGRKNFYARMNGKLNSSEWKDIRSNELYSRGDKSKSGNLNIRIFYEDGRFFLEIADTIGKDAKAKHSPRIREELVIPDKFFEEIVDFVVPDKGYDMKAKKHVDVYKPYTVQILRKNGEYFVTLIMDEDVPGSEMEYGAQITSDLVAGIDVNIDRIAVSILSKNGNFRKSKVFYCHEMEYVSSNRRDNVAGETAKAVIDYLLSENVGAVVLEDIKIKQDHDTDNKFNRLTHSFAKTKIQNCLIRRALRNGFRVKKVNPAYTSVIGRFKYSKLYGLSVHEAASFAIGRRGLGFAEKVPRELIFALKGGVKKHLLKLIRSKEETKLSKERVRYIRKLIKTIDAFKEQHSWSVWNVVHKTLRYMDYEYTINF
ncbi:transposase (plasmid) [Peptoclostridium acidaminophilum DSM 3953]|uniref:Transposase n=1 Tax=Peptoclostridium acidaminophilum DSM 3953 TaxID=1286171 RepID=W8TAK4_PEPAC|nr:IS200/IS605 family accessory protein TnpB-related protein [Peptoclostridium acidaminophilum]AHM57925.1 transposase [Peptoclostridium acidaminophilum DSM 3953]